MNKLILILLLIRKISTTTLINTQNSHYCIVEEPVHSTTFNFFGITKQSQDSIIKLGENKSLRIHFCQPLIKPCNGKEGYSVCLHTDSEEIAVGKEPPTVTVKHGKVMFEYSGDKCNATHNYTAHFEMKCDFSMGHEAAVDIDIIRERHPCHFDMVLETLSACTSRIETECSVYDNTGHYSLSPLTDYSNNYEIHVNTNLTVILNVCHSLLFGDHYSICSDAAICLIDKTDKSNIRYKSLGKLEQHSLIHGIGGYLQIEYDDGSLCDQNRPDAPSKMRSTILFVCDLNATDSSLPEYMEGLEVCHYKFLWRTIAACSEQVLQEHSLINKPCAVRDPITNYEYDLSILKYMDIKTLQNSGEYVLSVCSPLKEKICKPGSGVCRIQNDKTYGVSGGIANANLMWKEGGPYLNYTSGRHCASGQRKYTIIAFFCGRKNSFDIEEKPCSTIINMTTDIVCEHTCANNEINLERLTRSSSNYIIKSNDTEYHMNICRPLVPNDTLKCPPETGICKASVKKEGNLAIGINLGYPNPTPRVFNDGTAILSYENGSICEDDNDRNISSEILFICDFNIQKGTPEFRTYNNCIYYFEWKTKYGCGKVDGIFNNKCLVSNELGDYWNLTALRKNSVYHVKKSNENKTYNINICGGHDFCNESFICDEKLDYGRTANVQSDYAKNVIQFQFNNGSKCSNGFHARSTLNIRCNESIGVGEPILVGEEFCSIEFEWFTNVTCLPQRYLEPSTTEYILEANNLTLPSKSNTITAGEIVCIVIVINLILAAYWYFRNAERRLRFMTRTSI